jgi:2-keto-4-pentenoate hydratase/2-oxohepta-3-ene-1,7-dioic acid hydratase in catechol pathway
MRWIRYATNGQTAYGIVESDMVTEVRGDPFAGYEKTATRRSLSSLKLLVPVEPRTFYAAGLNYAEHAIAAANKRGEVPKLPEAADIGRKAKHLSESEALSCVLGWTIGNDMSERTWQAGDRTLWRAKNADTFKPMGPWIETDFDLDAAQTMVRVNGSEQINFRTNSMIYGPATFISRMSRYLTLYPGDVVWMGTEGVPENLKHGDTVEIEITGIGTLRNPVVREGR